MAEENKDQERTEKPSQKRRDEARQKGQTARSQDASSAAILLSCLAFFYFYAPVMMSKINGMMRESFRTAGEFDINAGSVSLLSSQTIGQIMGILFPLFVLVVAIAIVINLVQTGFIFSFEAIQPKLSKIDPIKGFTRLFSLRSLVELTKNIAKISVVAVVVYLTIRGELDTVIMLSSRPPGGILIDIAKTSVAILFKTCWVLVAIAILDYAYQRWEFEKNLKMSKQEVKDEHKQTEGDPLVKARIRRLQRERARHRMMAKVPQADVVVTNPTHLAIALKYDQESMSAPTVVAKGAGHIAAKIKEIARDNGIPLVENKPLAQVLNKMVDVDQTIPPLLYKAVAEVLAYVYQQNTTHRTGRRRT